MCDLDFYFGIYKASDSQSSYPQGTILNEDLLLPLAGSESQTIVSSLEVYKKCTDETRKSSAKMTSQLCWPWALSFTRDIQLKAEKQQHSTEIGHIMVAMTYVKYMNSFCCSLSRVPEAPQVVKWSGWPPPVLWHLAQDWDHKWLPAPEGIIICQRAK